VGVCVHALQLRRLGSQSQMESPLRPETLRPDPSPNSLLCTPEPRPKQKYNPYDLVVVDQSGVNVSFHFVMTQTGVTQVRGRREEKGGRWQGGGR
jgi:hypothetical protein